MKVRFFILHVLSPIVVGGLIYICWRNPSLIMFDWYHQISLGSVVSQIRASAPINCIPISGWILYSLPDALWVYSLTMFMAFIWSKPKSSIMRSIWLGTGFLFGIGIELCQFAGFVQGTFDPTDILLCCLAAATALSIVKHNEYKSNIVLMKERKEHEKKPKNEPCISDRVSYISGSSFR